MSRRRNGTNRAQAAVNASRYTKYARPKKKAVSLEELNSRIQKNIHDYCKSGEEENQDVSL